MTSWAERARSDVALRAFIEAEIGRACVRLASLEAEHEKDLLIIEALRIKVDHQAETIAALEKKGKR